MMMVPNIFGAAEPILGGAGPTLGVPELIFGGTGLMLGVPEPIFGGARLPNGQTALQKPTINVALTGYRKRLARRAVGPVCATLAGPSFSRHSGSTAAQPPSQRLGASMGFGQMQGRHPSKVSEKPRDRSGASPHQSCDSSWALMTNKDFSVRYFKSPMVSL
jgi:hypothetical protein